MKNNQARITRNEYSRKTISGIIAASPKDAIIKTADIVEALAKRYRGTNNHNAGNLLRERDDVEFVSAGKWRVL